MKMWIRMIENIIISNRSLEKLKNMINPNNPLLKKWYKIILDDYYK